MSAKLTGAESTMSVENVWSVDDLTKSTVRLTDHDKKKSTFSEKIKAILKTVKTIIRETTVEPCLFIYMMCISISTLAVQNLHLEKACRIHYEYGDEICDQIMARNTTELEPEMNNVQSMVAMVIAWKFPLQTAIPAVMSLFIGAWSDQTKRRKICIVVPILGEGIASVGLLLATYFFEELSLTGTALIETLPCAFTGSYIIIYMGMYSFMADRTTIENRTFRLGIVTICVSMGTPTGTALSGIILNATGYYGVFSIVLGLQLIAFIYGMLRLKDVASESEKPAVNQNSGTENMFLSKLKVIFGLVGNTLLVAVRRRRLNLRTQIFLVLGLYMLMVAPLYGDFQMLYLYAIRKFGLTEVEYSLYGTLSIILGLIGTLFCIMVLSKLLGIEDAIIGFIAGVSRIASCFVFAFAQTRQWFYAAPVFNMFSSVGLTAIRSIATKSVPTEEVGKLSSVMGVMEAIAPSVYMPVSSFIYVSTIDYFPGAFYMLDAAMTFVALGLFVWVYVLALKRRNINEISKTGEESRY